MYYYIYSTKLYQGVYYAINQQKHTNKMYYYIYSTKLCQGLYYAINRQKHTNKMYYYIYIPPNYIKVYTMQ